MPKLPLLYEDNLTLQENVGPNLVPLQAILYVIKPCCIRGKVIIFGPFCGLFRNEVRIH